jgi:hypothetical protein
VSYRTIAARYSGDSTHTASTESTMIFVFVMPHLTNVSQSAQRWRRGNALPRFTRARPPVGTTFTFTLDHGDYAQVQFDFTHVVPGRLVGGKSVAPTSSNRGTPNCRRTVTAATLRYSALVQNPALHMGRNSLHFEGRSNRRTWLAPGSYTLKLTATAYGRAARPAFCTSRSCADHQAALRRPPRGNSHRQVHQGWRFPCDRTAVNGAASSGTFRRCCF